MVASRRANRITGKKRKYFFFEKKKQKTFALGSQPPSALLSACAALQDKSLLVPFFTKELFLPCDMLRT
ncbi:MAG TPA: hypothetical protein VMB71_09965 [Acetobacteraceae bacterium]|nr:hypothetical protein [Acetobacteraceae bacterium]